MRFPRLRPLAIAAATLPVVLAATTSFGQIRVGEDGRAMDANPRVGSAGYNDGPPASFFNQSNANRIVTGNVTGFRQFRGDVQAGDPREFRQSLGSASFDDFIRRAGAAPRAYQPAPTNPFESQPFYGQQLAAPSQLPAGYVRDSATGVYLYTPQPTQPEPAIQGMGNFIDSRLLNLKPSDFLVPGPIDPRTNLPTMIMGSPLLGIRQMSLGNPNDLNFLQNYSSARDESALARLYLDPRTLELMASELGGTTSANRVDTQVQPSSSGAVKTPFEAPRNDTITPEPLDSSIRTEPLRGDVRPEGSSGRRLITPPRGQSTQYRDLEDQLRRYYLAQLETDQDRHRELQRQLQANEAQAGGAGIIDYNKFNAGLLAGGALKPGVAKPPPKQVTSLAEGVKAEGLAKVLRRAEDLMKEGKYASAMQQYNAALQVAPNNGLVLLGLAHAELGAGLYERAEQHLRAALGRDPVLTMAQFDLRSAISDQRLATVVRELKEAARKNEKDVGAPLLLAYVAYNSGAADQAKVFLDLAEKRAAANNAAGDRILRLLRTHWTLPDATDAAPKPADAPDDKPAPPR